MQARSTVVVAILVLIGLAMLLLLRGGADPVPPPQAAASAATAGISAVGGDAKAPAAVAADEPNGAGRTVIRAGDQDTGVRGIVVDARTAQPLGGVEIIAVAQPPSLQPLMNRFRDFLTEGLWEQTHQPVKVLGSTVSNVDGSFELLGLPAGLVYLDGRADGWFVRTPASTRLARGEIVDGVELRASPGGRVRGVVFGADGAPAAGAEVSLRPGLNAFLGQITERKYRWLEATTDADGRFDLPGVPAGAGYTISATSPHIALEEQFGIEVREGQVTEVSLHGHQGAVVGGVVVDAAGAPIAGANVAMVYLDMSRVLFSADGRAAPIVTDDDGRFRVERVASGRVAFIAAADGLAPSNIAELAVVDGGIYEDLQLQLGGGITVTGLVVDDLDRPLADAKVEVRPFERPDDPQFLKLALKIRRVEVQSGADGGFEVKGMSGERLVVQASKPGYTTAVRTGVKLDGKQVKVQLQRGAVIHGRVQLADGTAAVRFRVETRTRPLPQPTGAAADAASDGGSAATPVDDGRGRRGGMRMQFGRGRGMDAERTMQLPEGQTLADRGMDPDANWREIKSADGRFTLRGVPPGRISVRVRADGCRDADEQKVDLQATQESAELLFQLGEGVSVSGIVVDAGTRKPVADAQVTAYKQRENRNRGPLDFQIDPEDFDFMALASTRGGRSAVTDSSGSFAITALEPGSYRFTARHPDLAKASAKDVDVQADKPVGPIEIELDAGGGIEGTLTGVLQRPLADAMVVAFSIQAGSMKSSTTDRAGHYRIDGLPPGQYVVFKSRMDEHSENIALDLMSNMRLKTVTVRQGRFTRLDIQDDGEDGVRVHGLVREHGQPVARALVTVLGSDRDGILGMGVRAASTKSDGNYELAGIKPGSYLFQISRFRGTPMQTSMSVEVPADTRDWRFDIELPTSEVSGQVFDSRGRPVAGIMVTLGAEDGSLSDSEGLIGMIAQGGLSQARTDEAGNFALKSVAAGSYRLNVGSRMGGPGGRRGGNANGDSYGEACLDHVVVDGNTPVQGLVVTLPLAGRITGTVVDGSGNPVVGAQIHYQNQDRAERQRNKSNPLTDLLGMQPRPFVSGADGRFEVRGLTPGTYNLRADADGLETGVQDDVAVHEDQVTDVTLRIVRGATLKLRATNVDKQQIPFANLSLLDGKGRRVVSQVSTLTVMRRLLSGRDQVEDSGWYEFGSVPPDTYTLLVSEPGKPEIRITRTIADGETVAWDIDVAAELAARSGR